MKTERQMFVVHTSQPPVVEVDPEAGAVYVRFKRARVARTVSRPARTMHLAVDLDAQGEVIGIEAVGVDEFRLSRLLRMADVEAPRVDLAEARFRPVPTGLRSDPLYRAKPVGRSSDASTAADHDAVLYVK